MATAKGVTKQEPMSFTSALLRASCPDIETKRQLIRDYTEEDLLMELSRRVFEQEMQSRDTAAKIGEWTDRLYDIRHKTISTRKHLNP